MFFVMGHTGVYAASRTYVAGLTLTHSASKSPVIDDFGDTSVTYSSVALGTARTDRRVFVLVSQFNDFGNGQIPTGATMTVGSTNYTFTRHAVESQNGNNSGWGCGIFSAPVPAGTSGSLRITFGSSMRYTAIRVMTASSLLNATPFDAKATDTTSGTLNVNAPEAGFIVGAASGSNSLTWTGIQSVNSSTRFTSNGHGGGGYQTDTAEQTYALSTNARCACYVSWV